MFLFGSVLSLDRHENLSINYYNGQCYEKSVSKSKKRRRRAKVTRKIFLFVQSKYGGRDKMTSNEKIS